MHLVARVGGAQTREAGAGQIEMRRIGMINGRKDAPLRQRYDQIDRLALRQTRNLRGEGVPVADGPECKVVDAADALR